MSQRVLRPSHPLRALVCVVCVACLATACDTPSPDAPSSPDAQPASSEPAKVSAKEPAPRAEPAGPAPLGALLPEQLDRMIVLRGAESWASWRDALRAAPECSAEPLRCAMAPIEGLPALDLAQAEAMGWALDEDVALVRFGSTAAVLGVPAQPMAGALSAWARDALGDAPVATREVERDGWTVGEVVRGEGDQAQPVLAWMERRGRALVWFGPALAKNAPALDRATAVWVASIARPRLLTWMPYSSGRRALGALGPLWGYSALAPSAAAPGASPERDPVLGATHVVWSSASASARRSVWLQTHTTHTRALASPHLSDSAPTWLTERPNAAWVHRAVSPEALPAQPLALLQVGMAGPAAARTVPIPTLKAVMDGAPDGALVVASEPVPEGLDADPAALNRGFGAFRRPLWREGWTALHLLHPARAEAALAALADTRQLMRVDEGGPAYAIALARDPLALICVRRGWLVLAHAKLKGVCDASNAPDPAPPTPTPSAFVPAPEPPSLASVRGASKALRAVDHVAATQAPRRLLRGIAAAALTDTARIRLHPLGLALDVGQPAPTLQDASASDADPADTAPNAGDDGAEGEAP